MLATIDTLCGDFSNANWYNYNRSTNNTIHRTTSTRNMVNKKLGIPPEHNNFCQWQSMSLKLWTVFIFQIYYGIYSKNNCLYKFVIGTKFYFQFLLKKTMKLTSLI